MDEVIILFVACLCMGSTVFALIGLMNTLRWLASILFKSDEVRLGTSQREAVVKLLQDVRDEPDPIEALDEVISGLIQKSTIPAGEPLPLPPAEPTPQEKSESQEPVLLPPSDDIPRLPPSSPDEPAKSPSRYAISSSRVAYPLPVDSPIPLPPKEQETTEVAKRSSSFLPALFERKTTDLSTAVFPEKPSRSSVRRNWLSLDNITLLLYLGAALVVIAAGAFVGSSWGAISGIARWGIVAVFAALFLGTGEAFIRQSEVLKRAGETFRGVGMLLLPFVALAYDRFVLDGDAPPLFWVIVSAVLAALYYWLYHVTSTERLTAYLSTFSLGVLAILLPDTLGLDNGWQASALLAMSGALFAVAWQVEPDGRRLLKRLQAGQVSILAESHLIIGVLYLIGSWPLVLFYTFGEQPAITAYFVFYTPAFSATCLLVQECLAG